MTLTRLRSTTLDYSSNFTHNLVKRAGKALIITPSGYELDLATDDLVPEGFPVFEKGDIEATLLNFAAAETGVLALANRYDGMDLPGEACRMTVMDGAPGGAHLQERFFVGALGAGRVLEERIRTRVVQGAGRCTRGLKDYAIVVVLGDQLTRFLSRREVLGALRPEVQAEVQFGLDNSEVDEAQQLAFIDSFLAQDETWQQEAEPAIGDLRREAAVNFPAGTEALAIVAADEVKAWELLWIGNFRQASQVAQDLTKQIAEESLRSYRAFWVYLASGWLATAGDEGNDATLAAAARELLRKAHGIARGTTWLREVQPLAGGEEELDDIDATAVGAVAVHPARELSAMKWAQLEQEVRNGLSGTKAGPFEGQLTALGGLLGAEAFRPDGQGRADSVWLFGNYWWLTLEAKSEADPEGLLSMNDVRRANTQLRSLAADRDHPIPPNSASIVISPKQLAHPDAAAIADSWVHLSAPDEVLSLAADALSAWGAIRASAHGLDDSALRRVVERELAEHRVLPSHIRERLVNRPVNR